MCRFIQIKSEKPIQPAEILSRFSQMCKNSRTFDGDWQGDGWGIAWKSNEQIWQVQTSLKPIWECEQTFTEIPQSVLFLAHARSASFPGQKGILEYNQPYISGKYAFVFNGLLKGVNLPFPVAGKIGAQKIWNLLQKELEENKPETALNNVVNLLRNNSRQIQALNIGLNDGDNQYAVTIYTSHPEYYNLRAYSSEKISIICSEPLPGFAFQKIPTEKIFKL